MSVFFHSLIAQSALGLTLVAAAAAAWTTGCRSESQPSAPAPQAAQPMAHETGQPMNMADGEDAADAEVPASFAALSPADRDLAIKQKVCPVTGEPLGTMGTPIKVTVAGHEVFICCPGCKEPLEKDPAKYLAKLGIQPTTM